MNRLEHLLTILGEEATEVAHRASKAIRFGLNEIQPGQPHTNLQRLHQELMDLIAAVDMIADDASAPWLRLQDDDAIAAKQAKVEKFLAYSLELGTLQP